ncbi:hypothetical protein IW261DRAFT_1626413 [Armillaria novae-zelandiae]|uniref:Heterokaryon incompatibility domain-containing protein n=1 Tax=Armillaria novae-zelandiae TaxID=153914 RepID=A0AA39P948_9AGAR|nr:hypothetical protein IW261DRAFT_1626413 [Armillaria novae-zelandiae]
MMDSESRTSGKASTSEERFTGYWARFKAWYDSTKWIISNSWQKKKMSVSKWFERSEVSLCYDKGNPSVDNNALELNKIVTRRPPIYQEDPELPETTLTALAETGRTELTVPVLKQRHYTGNSAAIPSAIANIPCADLGVDRVLKRLNATLSTSYSLGSEDLHLRRKTTLRSILKPYVIRNDDFGTVYSYLRCFWVGYDVPAIEHALYTREEEDRKMREEVLVHGRITRSDVPPRRVWDLRANRVVPFWIVGSALLDNRGISRVWGISHAWVDENDRMNVMTPINGYEWPVPMPNDADLDLIRIEMLNHGAQYAWLDVLCLRQEGGKDEHLRVVCYFNGLGRPLHLTRDYFESDRCWFRRAWTLQEITDDAIIGGETGDDITEEEVRKTFDKQLAHLRELRKQDFALDLVLEMRNRVSSKPLDKVAGLAYLLRPDCIPIYDAELSDSDAWEVLLDVMSSSCRVELFFYFPEHGNGRKYWPPSWQQIMAMKHRLPRQIPWLGYVRHGGTGQDWYEGYVIDSANVRGLDEGLEEDKPRKGNMFFKNATGVSCTFKIFADHVCPIPDGSYAVLGADIPGPWVVGWLREGRKFEKVSVFSSAEDVVVTMGYLGLEEEDIILS